MAVKKKDKVIFIAFAIVLVVLLGVLFFVGGSKKETAEEDNFMSLTMTIPDADVQGLTETKSDGYSLDVRERKTNIDDLWGSMENTLESKPVEEVTDDRPPVSISSAVVPEKVERNRETVNDRLEKYKEQRRREEAEEEEARQRYLKEKESQRLAQVQALSQKQTTAPTEQVSQKEEAEEEEKDTEPKSRLRSTVVTHAGGSYGSNEKRHSKDPVRVMFTKTGVLKSGQRVSVRLMEDLYVNGIRLTANTHLTGLCSISDSRLNIVVSAFSLDGKIHKVNLIAYDTDGTQGLYCPTTETQTKMKQAGQTAVNLGSTLLRSGITGTVGQAVNTGMSILAQSNSASVKVPSGYEFYMIQEELR